MFKMLCGPAALRNVVLVTTMWDEADEVIGAQREEELRAIFWKSLLESGSQMARFKHTSDSAWEIVERLSGLQRRPLRLQTEISDQGKELSQTAAGKTLFTWLTKMMADLQAMMKKLKELLASGKSSETRGELQDQMSAAEERFRRAGEQRERIRARNRSFADVVRGGGSVRSPSSSSLIATPSKSAPPSFVESPLSRIRSYPSSIFSDSPPLSASSSCEASTSDEWLGAMKSGLGLVTAMAEIPPVPFLKGVAGLSLKIVEMVDVRAILVHGLYSSMFLGH